MFGGTGAGPVPRGLVGRLLLLIDDIRLCPGEKGVCIFQGLNPDSLSEVAALAQPLLEDVALHLIGRGDLDGFPIESVDEVPQGFFRPLHNGFQRRCCFGMTTGSCKMFGELGF